jgi:hypothetical protein
MAKVIKLEGTFKGFSIASSGMATIRFKAPYSEIATYVSLIGVQEKEVTLAAKENENDKFQKIGEVKLKEIKFKGEDGAEFIFKGESMAIPTFNSFLDKTVIFAIKCEEDGDV